MVMHNGSLLRTRPLLAMGTAASCTRQWAMLTYLVWFYRGVESFGYKIKVRSFRDWRCMCMYGVCTSNIIRSALRTHGERTEFLVGCIAGLKAELNEIKPNLC